ncbi:hypothetical protein CTAYLR_005427 [Chrysophaeum taylorii]|uniref:Charged multivesicular body protein 3 n=1 Tax=Chrysophaeum taylorii TaxID=2483200 RepID=A0AAD7UJS7_9STRA|nr:hypothetical protein CTAYLR_005427 [Chrysophaeum taylorii]
MSGVLVSMGLRKAKDPLEDLKKWKRDLAKEMRSMDREVKKMDAAEKKSADECRKLGKANRIDACKILAKEIVRTRAAKERMYAARATLNSVSMQLQTQASMVRAAGCMKRSAEVMSAMNKLVKLPELQKTMTEMAREMERAGLIEEMVNDAMEIADGADVEEETEKQINSVVAELTGDLFKDKNVTVPTAVPQSAPAASEQPVAEEEEEPGDLDAMKARLQAL